MSEMATYRPVAATGAAAIAPPGIFSREMHLAATMDFDRIGIEPIG